MVHSVEQNLRNEIPVPDPTTLDNARAELHGEMEPAPRETIDTSSFPEGVRNLLEMSPELQVEMLAARKWAREQTSTSTLTLVDVFGLPADTSDEILGYSLEQPRLCEPAHILDLS